MKKFECLVKYKYNKVTERIIRWFDNSEAAFIWLELEGCHVIWVREIV